MTCDECHAQNGECLLNYKGMTCPANMPTQQEVYEACDKEDCPNCSASLNCIVGVQA